MTGLSNQDYANGLLVIYDADFARLMYVFNILLTSSSSEFDKGVAINTTIPYQIRLTD